MLAVVFQEIIAGFVFAGTGSFDHFGRRITVHFDWPLEFEYLGKKKPNAMLSGS